MVNEDATRLKARRLYQEVEEETKAARGRFLTSHNHLDRDLPDRTYWVSVILESIGKIARCCNKLAIASEPEVRKTWTLEAKVEIVRAMSLLRRMHERFDELGDTGSHRAPHRSPGESGSPGVRESGPLGG